jgi:hypothetical protein
MLIVPFIHNILHKNNIQVNIIKILTIGGRYIWEEDDSIDLDTDILNSNDIYRKGQIIKLGNNLQLCEVDTIKTNIQDFYKWEELTIEDIDTFCWRTFIYLTGNSGDNWLDIPENEMLSKYKIKHIVDKIIQRNNVI